jgi:hypothetical protein
MWGPLPIHLVNLVGSFDIFHLGPAKKSFKNWRERERGEDMTSEVSLQILFYRIFWVNFNVQKL